LKTVKANSRSRQPAYLHSKNHNPENGFLDRRAGWREFTGKALAFV
jgi:hypothetical protein